MHELGVVFTVIRQIEEVCDQNHVTQVNRVTLEIGEVSTVVPRYLEEIWVWAVDNRSKYMHGCKLVIERIEAITHCDDCNQDFRTVDHGKKCPYCGSDNTYLLVGNGFNIKEIEVADN